VSPVSKGRKRKRGKGAHKTAARYDRSVFARTPTDLQTHEFGLGSAAYSEDRSPDASPPEVGDILDRRARGVLGRDT